MMTDKSALLVATTASLWNFDQVPGFMRKNPYIRSGYRQHLSPALCIRSAFWWTNETMNIWTHLSGCGLLTLLLLYDLTFIGSTPDISTGDFIVLTLTAMSFQFCLICSAAYHMFSCHSESAYEHWLFWDILGVSTSLTFIFISGIHFAFHCYPVLHTLYSLSVAGLFCTVISMQIHPKYRSDKYFYIRLILFIIWASYGVVPVLHWIYLRSGVTSFIVQTLLKRIVIMYAIAAAALTIYITKCPERLWPGKLDFIGSSHQWWHVLVVLAFYWWHNTGIVYTQLRKYDQCVS